MTTSCRCVSARADAACARAIGGTVVAMLTLADCDLGFRSAYLDYERLTAQLERWAAAFPELVRVRSLVETPEGRQLWLLTIGPDPDRVRPAAWVDGNMHASEFSGTNVALAIAEDVLRLHLEGADAATALGLSAPVAERLRAGLFYVVPRISPDGAEQILRTGAFVRSVPRDARVERGTPRWRAQDIDGDGRVLCMRVVDPGGELVESAAVPGLLVERTLDDAGPFYKLYPEGIIEHFDGKHVPTPSFLSDNPVDLNRNFPWSWAPGHEQLGAGAFATSEPEARAIVEFTSKHPEIISWLNLHTFGGVLIRPLGNAPDAKMDQEDLAVFRQVEAWMSEHTGYPTVSGYEEFLYEPDRPIRGDLSDYGYHQRGALAYTVELWDLFTRLEMPRPAKFVQFYDRVTRADLEKLARWDREHNQGRCFGAWVAAHHPQLGAVELGGIDPRIGIWNPPPHDLAAMCQSQARAYLRVAAMAPALRLGAVSQQALPGELTRVDVRVENHGYLGTFGLPSAKKLEFNEPVYATAEVSGCELVDAGAAHQVLGHLDGWGHGLHTGANLPAYPQTRGTTNARTATFLVRGRGTLRVRAGCARVGFVETLIVLA
jgi:Zinc carboxypeptidase